MEEITLDQLKTIFPQVEAANLADITGEDTKGNTILSSDELEKLGFRRVDDKDYSTGIREHGMTDPREVLEAAKKDKPDRNYLIHIPSAGQFDVDYQLWYKAEFEILVKDRYGNWQTDMIGDENVFDTVQEAEEAALELKDLFMYQHNSDEPFEFEYKIDEIDY